MNIDRNTLEAQYIERILESMDLDTLVMIAQEHLEGEFKKFSDEELHSEVAMHYPDLLDLEETDWKQHGRDLEDFDMHTKEAR